MATKEQGSTVLLPPMSTLAHPSHVKTVAFSLKGNALKFDSTLSIQPYLVQLDKLPDVEQVILSGNTFGVEPAAAMAKALTNKLHLTIADFSDIFTGRLISEIPLALTSLCTSLLHLPHLTSLDLSDNAFGGRSVKPMLQLLSTHPYLQVLKLSNNGLGPVGGATVAQALLANAELSHRQGRQPALRRIICGRNRLENGSADDWAAAFASLASLVEVRLPQNGIRMEGIASIVKGLRECKGLEILDLQDNTATERGSRAIAASLPSWPQLLELNLSDCLLRAKGGLSIMSALGQGSNPLLTSLKLQSNELDLRAINSLASGIALHLTDLVDLELNGNRGEAEDECYEKVRRALEAHGHEDALDELDEMEEDDGDDDDDDEEDAEEVVAEITAHQAEEEKVEGDSLTSLMGKVRID